MRLMRQGRNRARAGDRSEEMKRFRQCITIIVLDRRTGLALPFNFLFLFFLHLCILFTDLYNDTDSGPVGGALHL